MPCKRCASDMRPVGFGNDRGCAFDADGAFTPDNWNCGTIDGLLGLEHAPKGYVEPFRGMPSIIGSDESMDIIPVPPEMDTPDDEAYAGWVILTRYKRRGKTSSAVHVGDFWPPQPLTLALADAMIASACATLPPSEEEETQ